MFLKIHRAPQTHDIVAVCDGELINTIISDGDVKVHITEAFYGARRASEDEVREALKNAVNANIMGERAVAIAIELGLVSRAGCIMMGSVPHALIFRL
jgi:hypothetical protein